ncbi:hypothetical protein ACFY64_13085 [Streptomyces collinus]|uniref:hypothetical protein n=1 Tax=Streptomyces collinus TaxID=42684 RepID=UPI0036CF1A79
MTSYAVVIPTLVPDTLADCLAALAAATGPRPEEIVLVAEFARARIVPGPRTRHEVATMLATSVLIPPTATWHRLAGAWRHRHTPAWQEEATP